MTRLTVDAEFQAKIAAAGGPMEICDESGQTIAILQPVPAPGELKKMSPFSQEQLDEFRQQRGGRPLAEIWKDLESRQDA